MHDSGGPCLRSGPRARPFAAWMRRFLAWGYRTLPSGIRSVLGMLFIIAGIFGLLPLLGFWMIPLGGLLIALDIPPLRRSLVSRLRTRWKKASRS